MKAPFPFPFPLPLRLFAPLAGAILSVSPFLPSLHAAPPPRPLFHETFDGFHSGKQNAAQVASGLPLSFAGALPSWEHQGSGSVHAVLRAPNSDYAVLIWTDNVLTLRNPIPESNGKGRHYRIAFDLGPTVYATPSQATGPLDELLLEVLRPDGSVLASSRHHSGPWQGKQTFRQVRFDYAGDGSGPIRLRLQPSQRSGRFAGALDNLTLSPHGAEEEHFNTQVVPILAAQCLSCHRGAGAKGGLDLGSLQGAMAGGKNGPAIVPRDLEASELWQQIASDEMPPKHPLQADQKRVLKEWIRSGAVWGQEVLDPFAFSSERRAGYDWWSLQPLQPVQPPPTQDASWERNPVDRFILRQLTAKGLSPSPRADPHTLVRRLYIDLTGLPPAPEDVASFAADPSPQAWEHLIDRLLSSPHYGERWGRHWLDLVRFGESDGYEYNSPREGAWPYRDWVIRALNADMPYAQFVQMQLAGDVLQPDSPDGIAAASFLVTGVHNRVGFNEQQKQDELEDLLSTIGQSFLGMTLNCARCHDHKFDPISTEDYYRFGALLNGVSPGVRQIQDAGNQEVAAYTVVPSRITPVHVLLRGEAAQKGPEVLPGGLRALRHIDADLHLNSTSTDAERRQSLAAWMTDKANAPFLRVIVNRVWLHHFGRGIVDTPSDFGFNGERPTHPELLEWLSTWFQAEGQSLKKLHRLILTSATYQQSSASRAEASAIDGTNRLLWRQNPRRVEAEVLRDSILAVAGELNLTPFGPGFHDVKVESVPPTYYYLPFDPIGPEFHRRTVYRWSPRGQRSALLETFDCPDPSVQTPKRGVTTTPSQALSQWNSSFVLRMSRSMATRIHREAQANPSSPESPAAEQARQVHRAWQLALGRSPKDREQRESLALLQRHDLALLCRALLNTNEFIFIP